jgi:hypothetical protein
MRCVMGTPCPFGKRRSQSNTRKCRHQAVVRWLEPHLYALPLSKCFSACRRQHVHQLTHKILAGCRQGALQQNSSSSSRCSTQFYVQRQEVQADAVLGMSDVKSDSSSRTCRVLLYTAMRSLTCLSSAVDVLLLQPASRSAGCEPAGCGALQRC